ncbi:hypothetical protein J4421_05775 [Candidatus Woesearchaeota archaeon]|nr:hypothetical protein [Candidatus Woesearchaeota archaeon]
MIKEEIEISEKKHCKISCCRSYTTPKGRCYTCPEELFNEENELPDPDDEKW